MYKVFINEKRLILSSEPQDSPKTLNYDGSHSFDFAIDLLENTASQGLNIYHNNIEELWPISEITSKTSKPLAALSSIQKIKFSLSID